MLKYSSQSFASKVSARFQSSTRDNAECSGSVGLCPHVKESAIHLLTARPRNTAQWKQLSLSPSYSAYSGFAEPKSKSEYMRLLWRRQPVLSTPCSPYESVPIKGFPLSAVERFLPTLTI